MVLTIDPGKKCSKLLLESKCLDFFSMRSCELPNSQVSEVSEVFTSKISNGLSL